MNKTQLNNEIDNLIVTGALIKAIQLNPLIKLLVASSHNADDNPIINSLSVGGATKIAAAETVKTLNTSLQALTLIVNNKVEQAAIDLAVNSLLDSVPVQGNTLNKLYNLIQGIQTLIASDNVNLDSVQELVDVIEDVQQWISTILVDDLETQSTTKALTAKQGYILKQLLDDKIDIAEKGAVDGVASLDSEGKTPISQLPSTVLYANSNSVYGTITDAGTNEYILNANAITTLSTGVFVFVKPLTQNTGAATLQINAFLAYPIYKKNGTQDLVAGDLKSNAVYMLVFQGNHFRVLNQIKEIGDGSIQQVITQATTTSTTPVLLGGMLISIPTGTYIFTFTGSFQHNSANGEITVAFYVNGNLIAESLCKQKQGGIAGSGLENSLVTEIKATVITGQNIEIRWNVNSGTGICNRRSITYIQTN